jgi:sugar O-acyltransferase (sialic acid O-acetyltransferase NeuD family)
VAGWVLYACRTPYAAEVAETVWRRGETVALLVDNLASPGAAAGTGEEDLTVPIGAPVLRPDELDAAQRELPVAIPLITPGHRFAVEAEARALGFGQFPALLDPSAVLARTATIGEGSTVNAAAIVAALARVGRFASVNRGASIGHHSEIEDFATLGPGCVLAGHVRVGRGAFLGAGAVCAPKVAVGPNAIVGAGAVVIADVPAGSVVVGNPARAIRESGPGYGDVSVPA